MSNKAAVLERRPNARLVETGRNAWARSYAVFDGETRVATGSSPNAAWRRARYGLDHQEAVAQRTVSDALRDALVLAVRLHEQMVSELERFPELADFAERVRSLRVDINAQVPPRED